MISANELRIGNKIKYGAHILTVSGIVKGDIVKTDEFIDGNLEVYEPIPLTPEILDKCGFKAEENVEQDGHKWMQYYLETDRFNFLFNSDGSSYDLECGAGWSIIHNVHQLQNLYFALTGTEINVKL